MVNNAEEGNAQALYENLVNNLWNISTLKVSKFQTLNSSALAHYEKLFDVHLERRGKKYSKRKIIDGTRQYKIKADT